VPLVIALLSWRPLALEPRPGLDNSWQAALHMALHEGITFGDHLIFTYGPVGFLSAPTLWYSDTGTVAVLYTVLLRYLLALALFWGARRTYGTVVGAIVALLVASASNVALGSFGFLVDVALVAVTFLIFCVWMIDRDSGPRGRLLLVALGGAFAALELLNAESIGVEIAVLALVMALALPGRSRDHVIVTLAGFILALLVVWTVTGQNLGALPAYARNLARIISGYAGAMSLEAGPGLRWEYTAAWVAFAIGLAGALQMTAWGPRPRRWGIVVLWVVFCFFESKEAFVRHDSEHGLIYFVALLCGFLALRWRQRGRLVGFGLTAVLFTFAVTAQERSFSTFFDPVEHASSAVNQLEQVTSPSERASIMAKGRQEFAPIAPRTLQLLEGHTVHVYPYEAGVVWAYHLKWRPLPVIQSYVAYTTGLDEEDAHALSSAQAPQRILRGPEPAIDRRVQAFDEGLTIRTILCRYQELRTTAIRQVLALGPNRCGAPIALGTVHAGWGEAVEVPAPPNGHSFVFVRIGGVAVAGFERLYALLYKPAERAVLLDGNPYRLVPGTATDGLLLRAPVGVDFAAPFNLAPDSSTIAVAKAGQGTSRGTPITFSFFAQSVSPGPRSPIG
jgi:hypothetical protein